MPESRRVISLFNSSLETGVRALIVLNAAHPEAFDLSAMTLFDHLVVHTADIGGPNSLHPDLPHRSGELLVRRRTIESGLTLMRRLHYVDVIAGDDGVQYRATDEAHAFVALMRSQYAEALKVRAKWMADNIIPMDSESLEQLVKDKIGRWRVEFQNEREAPGKPL